MITSAALQFFFQQGNVLANKIYADVPLKSTAFSTRIPVAAEDWKTAWIGLVDKFRPWDGPRVTKEPAPQTYTVTVYPYEGTQSYDRFRFEDDQRMFGVVSSELIPRLAREARMAQDYEIRDLLQNKGKWTGAYQNGWDGSAFFLTTHAVDLYDSSKGTYTNDLTGGGASIGGITVGGQFSQTAIQTLWEYQGSIKGEDNEPLQVESDTILVPRALKGEAELVLKSTFYAPPSWGTIGAGTGALGAQVGAADNALRRFGIDYIEWPLLDASSKSVWYMMSTKNPAFKPLLWLVNTDVQWTYIIQPQSMPVFSEHRFIWGGHARWAPAWGPSWLLMRSGT